MWEIERFSGHWFTIGWVSGHIRECLDVVPDKCRLRPCEGPATWVVTCPMCAKPMVHYINTKCRECGEIDQENWQCMWS